jgi:8-oxo-dGTP diphosphatase
MSSAYQFCPYCGGPLDWPARVVHPACARCGRTFFQNSKPCVGSIIVRGGQVLLVKRGIEPFKGDWDIPGGFLQPGEPPAEGARREALEETGLDVALTGLVGLYMDTYPEDVATLTIFYEADVVAGELAAGDDAVDTHWFPRDAIPANLAFACCRAAMADWRRRGVLSVPD